ncbi:MAG: 6,7-dimethyl-8-ribityllumazine synthase [Candidatus Neomarinimicrobiota bacterium]|nr:6,7-dimethyl-8-ribityllumazine synthase [Candidatus Neomarinimicrobiota bacterium]|tara:strand:- start:1274 stop:1750 length:477 start_codon:yes stop_codon:yes gene_type:complete
MKIDLKSKKIAKSSKISIVISEFNTKIIERLLSGAMNAYAFHGGLQKNLKVHRLPGAFEIPGTVNLILNHHDVDAIVALGAVIRGETPHFDFVARESANGLAKISRNSEVPIINGILTTDNVKQAMSRSNMNGVNKGWDAMEAALSTILTYNEIKRSS